MKAFKLRPRQREQQRYAVSTLAHPVSEELTSGSGWAPSREASFVFTANEAEVYSVLGVAQPGDAAWMLSRGVRSAEDASDFMRSHGAEQKMVERKLITAESLRRGIASTDFMSRMRLAAVAHPVDSDGLVVVDVIELSTIGSLSEQWGFAAREVRNGVILLTDIKSLGVSKLRNRRRLIGVIPALQAVREEDAGFSLSDLKVLVDRAQYQNLSEAEFNAVIEYLVEEGVDGVTKTESLKTIRLMMVKHYDANRSRRVTYEIDFRKVYERKAGESFPEKALVTLFDAGVPAERAAELINEGMPVESIIGVTVGGIETPLAGGWL